VDAATDTIDAQLLADLLGELPFGVAVLEPEGEAGGFSYVFGNAAYEHHAPRIVAGSPFVELSDWPSPDQAELRRVYESGESWSDRTLPSHEPTQEPRPFLRMVRRFVSGEHRYLLDVLVDTNAPFVESTIGVLASALDNQRSAARAGAELVNASLIARVASLASSSLTLQRICERTLSGMREQIADLVSGAIYVLDPDGTALQPLALFRKK